MTTEEKNMPTVVLTNEQVVELIKQLPVEEKRAILETLTAEQEAWWEETVMQGEQQLRRLCAERGRDWDHMSEEEREDFIDDLIHEDR
jgi:hypothetical protein